MKISVSIADFFTWLRPGTTTCTLSKRQIRIFFSLCFSVLLSASLCKFFLVTQSVTESHGVSQR